MNCEMIALTDGCEVQSNEFADVFTVKNYSGSMNRVIYLTLRDVRELAAYAEKQAEAYAAEWRAMTAFDGAVALAKIAEAITDCEPRDKFIRACIALRRYAKTTRDADKYGLLECKRFCEAMRNHNML